jgi:murein DD-endopeptidase MepM/ murein hydrolase activator NlpD
MKKSIAVLVIILVAMLSGFHSAGAAAAPNIVLAPKKAGPGDLLLITVKNTSGPVLGKFAGQLLYFNPSGNAMKAIVGVDLNRQPGLYTLELTINGARLTREVRIFKKKYPLQRLTLPKEKVVLSPENEARVDREEKKLSLIWPVDSIRLWNGNFQDPLPGKEITTPFGVRRIINKIPKSSHTGVDLAAKEGEPVRAPNDGVVVLAEDLFYSGNSIVIDHGQGIYTMFFHLSKMNVRYGQAVRKGDIIGQVGATGRVTGACLHWGARVQDARVDPLELIHLKLE